MQCGFSKVDKKEPIIVKVYFGGLGWIFAKKVSLVGFSKNDDAMITQINQDLYVFDA